MPSFNNGAVEIAYLDDGQDQPDAEPIVLVHGFASTKEVNWVIPGWVRTLTGAGRRVIALDNRGHGESSKLYDPAAYHSANMAGDVARCSIISAFERADVMGYSMGARIAAFLALEHPARVRSLVLGGLGIHLVEGVGLPESIADALEAPIACRRARTRPGGMFRAFAEQTRSDLEALAACIRGSRQTLEPRAGRRHSCCRRWSRWEPMTTVAGSAQELAALIPGARGARHSRAATTCWRSATRCSNRACSISLTSAHEPCALGHFRSASLGRLEICGKRPI